MADYNPDVWRIIKIDSDDESISPEDRARVEKGFYKILAGWYGGFAGADEWRMSSGVTKIIDKTNLWEIHNESGSIYRCGKRSENTSSLTAGILRMLQKTPGATVTEVDVADIQHLVGVNNEQQSN